MDSTHTQRCEACLLKEQAAARSCSGARSEAPLKTNTGKATDFRCKFKRIISNPSTGRATKDRRGVREDNPISQGDSIASKQTPKGPSTITRTEPFLKINSLKTTDRRTKFGSIPHSPSNPASKLNPRTNTKTTPRSHASAEKTSRPRATSENTPRPRTSADTSQHRTDAERTPFRRASAGSAPHPRPEIRRTSGPRVNPKSVPQPSTSCKSTPCCSSPGITENSPLSYGNIENTPQVLTTNQSFTVRRTVGVALDQGHVQGNIEISPENDIALGRTAGGGSSDAEKEAFPSKNIGEADDHLINSKGRFDSITKKVTRDQRNVPKKLEDDIGLFKLSDAGADAKIDLIAVHGINGHHTSTWTHKNGHMWLRDFLPRQITNLRIFSYGYASKVTFSRSVSSIDDFGRDLLNRVQVKRSIEGAGRPIIFICHSLGGLIVKKALIIAHEDQEDFRDISSSTRAICFFGTPHKGTDVATWAKKLLTIAKVILPARSSLVGDLQPSSGNILRLTTSFRSRAEKLRIISFYERRKIQKLNLIIVDKEDAVMNVSNEKQIPLERDHREMCRFETCDDGTYEVVWGNIKNVVESLLSEEVEGNRIVHIPTFHIPIVHIPFPQNPNFVGRREILESIETHFLGFPAEPIVLQGMGGIGKTQIALKYSYQRQERNSSVLWVRVNSIETMLDDINVIEGKINGNKPKDGSSKYTSLKEWLDGHSDWLLVIDNGEEPEIWEKINQRLPFSTRRRGHAIYTSRDRRLALDETGAIAIDVPTLSELDSQQLFEKYCESTGFSSSDASETLVASLMTKLSGLPLALSLAGAYFSYYRNTTIKGYLDAYEDSAERIELLKFKQHFSGYNKSIMTTWNVSFERVCKERPQAGKLFELLGFLGGGVFMKDIRETIGTKSIRFGSETHEWGLPSAIQDSLRFLKPGEQLKQSVGILEALSLLTCNGDDSDGNYTVQLHPLVKDWVQGRLPSGEVVDQVQRAMYVIYRNFMTPTPDFLNDCNVGKPSSKNLYKYLESISTVLDRVAKDSVRLNDNVEIIVFLCWSEFIDSKSKRGKERPQGFSWTSNLNYFYNSSIRFLRSLVKSSLAILEAIPRLAPEEVEGEVVSDGYLHEPESSIRKSDDKINRDAFHKSQMDVVRQIRASLLDICTNLQGKHLGHGIMKEPFHILEVSIAFMAVSNLPFNQAIADLTIDRVLPVRNVHNSPGVSVANTLDEIYNIARPSSLNEASTPRRFLVTKIALSHARYLEKRSDPQDWYIIEKRLILNLKDAMSLLPLEGEDSVEDFISLLARSMCQREHYALLQLLVTHLRQNGANTKVKDTLFTEWELILRQARDRGKNLDLISMGETEHAEVIKHLSE